MYRSLEYKRIAAPKNFSQVRQVAIAKGTLKKPLTLEEVRVKLLAR